jgi:hypothetical protein
MFISTQPNLKTHINYSSMIECTRDQRHDVDAHHLKTVVYAVFIMSLDDKSILIKIGSTKI